MLTCCCRRALQRAPYRGAGPAGMALGPATLLSAISACVVMQEADLANIFGESNPAAAAAGALPRGTGKKE